MSAPRAPVLGWASFSPHRGPVPAAIDQASVKAFTTSGRAALYQVLKQLGLPPGSVVLVPSYHCPTMVAPVLCAGLRPRFFAIDPDGLPLTSGIDTLADPQPRAMIAAHYFGLPQSMADLRAWCDRHKVTLIEDCAHSFFGQAGERPVGHWGDFATASVSKFFPVPEAGVIVAQRRQLRPLKL